MLELSLLGGWLTNQQQTDKCDQAVNHDQFIIKNVATHQRF